MTGELLSVGIDLGTSTTQLVISRLRLENSAGAFAVPKVEITDRQVIYRSNVHFTPLVSDTLLDADGIRAIVEKEYRRAGVTPEQFQTGAVIITGETARKENARQVLRALAGLAGDFVVATAGPDLESFLAGRGAGTDKLSAQKSGRVLHYDIGGGTSNLALFDRGKLVDTGCLDVGGRLIKIDPQTHQITYVFHKIVEQFPGIRPGVRAEEPLLRPALEAMADALLEAGGLKPPTALLDRFLTHKAVTLTQKPDYFTFSGGVADCFRPEAEVEADPFRFGDVGPLLGPLIRAKFEQAGARVLEARETIRATVVGAGSYATQVSGSTIFYQNVDFPIKNRPVLRIEEPFAAGELEEKLRWFSEEEVILALRGLKNPTYSQVQELARKLLDGTRERRGEELVVALETDMAKALGQCLAAEGAGRVLCLDSVSAAEGSYLDILAPAYGGAVLPVVVKTLAFEDAGGTDRGPNTAK